MSAISMSELLRRRAEEGSRHVRETVTPDQDEHLRNLLEEALNRTLEEEEEVRESQIAVRERGVQQQGRATLAQVISQAKRVENGRVTVDQQRGWLMSVGTTVNFYESREFTNEEIEEYYRILQEYPGSMSQVEAPRSLTLVVQYNTWKKSERARKLINKINGSAGYEDEVGKMLGEDEGITETGTVNLHFNDGVNLIFGGKKSED